MSLEDDFDAFKHETGGDVTMYVVQGSNLAHLEEAASNGDQVASRLFAAAEDFAKSVIQRPKRNPGRCVCCPRPFPKNEFSIVILLPEVHTPQNAMTFGICGRCATEVEEIRAKALSVLRQMFPDVKPADVTAQHRGGRA